MCVHVSIGKLRRRQFYSQPLENGKILQQGSTFTYQDVLDELLVYTPDGRGSGTDEIQFSVTDGIYTEMGRLEFSMDIRKREGPRVTINRGLQIAAGQDTPTLQCHCTHPKLFRMLIFSSPHNSKHSVVRNNLSIFNCF